MKAELKRAADLVAFQRREALSRKRLSGDPRNPFRPPYGAELTFAAASQEAETLGYILKLLEKEAARECARRVFPTLDAILDFVVGLGLMALGGLGLAAAWVVAGAPGRLTRAAGAPGLGAGTLEPGSSPPHSRPFPPPRRLSCSRRLLRWAPSPPGTPSDTPPAGKRC